MLWTIIVVLLAFGLLGHGTSYSMGEFVHLLLALGTLVILYRIVRGRRGRVW